jgi:hypothetical protein
MNVLVHMDVFQYNDHLLTSNRGLIVTLTMTTRWSATPNADARARALERGEMARARAVETLVPRKNDAFDR